MKKSILHSSYKNRVIESRDELATLLNRREFLLSYINLSNFRLEADTGITAFIIDSSVLARSLGVQCMSPDYSSVMDDLLLKSKRILYVGGRLQENITFIRKQQKVFPSKNHKGLSGYDIERDKYLQEIFEFAPDTIVLSLGYGFQESLGLAIKRSGFRGKIICSGAFISQESRSEEKVFYPYWIIKLNLRWLFRLVMEKSARKRIPKIVMNYMIMNALKVLYNYKKSRGNS